MIAQGLYAGYPLRRVARQLCNFGVEGVNLWPFLSVLWLSLGNVEAGSKPFHVAVASLPLLALPL